MAAGKEGRGGGWKVFSEGEAMISHLSIVYMRGASRQYGSTLNPPLLSLRSPPFSPSCGKYERGKGKKVWSSPAPCRDSREGESSRRGYCHVLPLLLPLRLFFELLTPEPPDQQAEEGKPGGNSLKFKSPNPLFFFLFEWQLRHGKRGREDQKQNPPTIFGSRREGGGGQ